MLYIASELVVCDTYIPGLIVISTTINQLRTIVSLITTYCMRLFVVYKRVMLQGQR